MTRGKYGAKAAKRQETQALEAEVAKLSHALARAEKERDEARESLQRLERSAAAERRTLLADAEAGASPKLHRAEAELRAEREGRAQDSAHYAWEVFALLDKYAARFADKRGLEEMAALFGQAHRLGELIEQGNGGPRRSRRATARTSRIIRDMNSAPEWAQAPAKAAK